MPHILFDRNWEYKVCESCRKNYGERIEMIWDGKLEMWICKQCGATKKL